MHSQEEIATIGQHGSQLNDDEINGLKSPHERTGGPVQNTYPARGNCNASQLFTVYSILHISIVVQYRTERNIDPIAMPSKNCQRPNGKTAATRYSCKAAGTGAATAR